MKKYIWLLIILISGCAKKNNCKLYNFLLEDPIQERMDFPFYIQATGKNVRVSMYQDDEELFRYYVTSGTFKSVILLKKEATK